MIAHCEKYELTYPVRLILILMKLSLHSLVKSQLCAKLVE